MQLAGEGSVGLVRDETAMATRPRYIAEGDSTSSTADEPYVSQFEARPAPDTPAPAPACARTAPRSSELGRRAVAPVSAVTCG